MFFSEEMLSQSLLLRFPYEFNFPSWYCCHLRTVFLLHFQRVPPQSGIPTRSYKLIICPSYLSTESFLTFGYSTKPSNGAKRRALHWVFGQSQRRSVFLSGRLETLAYFLKRTLAIDPRLRSLQSLSPKIICLKTNK